MIETLLMTKLLIGIGAIGTIGALGSAGYVYFSFPHMRGITELTLGRAQLMVEVADTPLARMKGLSNREEIGADGMLFLFDSRGTHGFWMKGMQFPLDIVWIRDREVVGIERNVPIAGTIPHIYYPPIAVDAVLELPAGDAERHDIVIGDSMFF